MQTMGTDDPQARPRGERGAADVRADGNPRLALVPAEWPTWAVRVGWLLVALGAMFCVRGLIESRTLYLDEVDLARNFVERDFTQLLRPLDGRQLAPIGFLAAQWWLVRTFGLSEITLRLVATLAAMGTLPLMLLLCRRTLSALGGLVAMALLVYGSDFVYYASQNKQYAVELLVATAMLWLTFRVMDRPERVGRLIAWALVAAASFWVAYTAVFVVAGLGVALAGRAWWRGRWRAIAPVAAAGLVVGASFMASYLLVIRPQRSDPQLMGYMQEFWGYAFLPVPVLNPVGFMNNILELFEHPGGMTYAGLAIVLFAVGWLHLGWYRRREAVAMACVAAVAAAASMLHVYPTAERLALYLLPVLLLPIGAGIDFTRIHGGWRTGVLVLLMAGLLLLHPLKTLGRVEAVDDLGPVLAEVERRYHPGDTIWVYGGAVRVFQHYVEGRRAYAYPGANFIYGIEARKEPRKYREDLGRAAGSGRAWLVFSHIYDRGGLDEDKLILLFADERGRRLESVRGDGAAAYLYDLGHGRGEAGVR